MKILVLNCGSSSLKYSLIELPEYKVITVGLIERIGTPTAFIKVQKPDGTKEEIPNEIPDHTRGVELILEKLLDPTIGHIKSLDEIEAVGHRLVHGGEAFSSSVIINEEVVAQLEKCIPLAPLHNPANIMGIRAAQKVMGDKPQCGIFDTAFHQTMPEHAYMYALPYHLYENHGVRRYGFHGTSHDYVSHRAAELVGVPYDSVRIITAHVGSGASISAIKHGKCVDTSMGMTPSEGLVMGTRAGDIDSGVVEFLLGKKDFDPAEIADYISGEDKGKRSQLTLSEVSTLLNKKSGVYGVGCIGSSDMRDMDKASDEGNKLTKLATEMLEYRLKKYIGAYAAALGGVDILVFTAGVGENRSLLRTNACKGLEFMGIKIDEERNLDCRFGKAGIISTDDSTVKVVVMPTDEEYMIASETYRLLQ